MRKIIPSFHRGLTRIAMIYFVVCICLCMPGPLVAQEELGQPLITNYSYRDYEAGPTNWWAIEDHRGIMYFANGQGVLEYDGANWRLIDVPGGSGSRSLAKDDEGKIYVGSIGEFGVLAPDARGQIMYQSLVSEVPSDERDFLDVWEIDFWQGAVYFRTTTRLYKWDGEKIKVIRADGDFHVGAIVEDKYYVRIWNVGLCVMEDDTFRVVPGGERFGDERIYVILPYDDDRLLIGTRDAGAFFLYDGRTFTPFVTEADPHLKGELYLPGLALDDGRFVLNTFSEGLFFIDKTGKLLRKISMSNGLQDNTVTHVFLDSRGVLWMSTFNGISKINLQSPFLRLGIESGLPSIIFDALHHNGVLYVGSNNGIYYYDEASQRFRIIEGTFGQSGWLIEHRNRLYAGSGGMGVIEIIGDRFEYVRENVNYDFRVTQMLHSERDPDRIYVSMQQGGVTSFYFNEDAQQYEIESRTNKIIADLGAFMEDSLGYLWAYGLERNTIARLEPAFRNNRLDLELSPVTLYDTSQGLPNGPVSFFNLDGDLQFVSDHMIYTFDPDREVFVEHTAFYQEFYDPNAPSYADPVKDPFGRTWFGAGKGVVISAKNSEGSRELIYDPFSEIKNFPVWGIAIDESSTPENTIAWFTGSEGMIRYEGNLQSPPVPPFAVQLRSFHLGNDSLLYGGAGNEPQDLVLNHRENTVSVEYASPFYLSEQEIEYQTFLVGLDKDWSAWTKQNRREYINLPSGVYQFKARAKNVYGKVSEPTELTFRISPPWYFTWWAYVLYLLGLVLLMYAIVRSRTNHLRRQQRELESKVEERTREVQQRVDELATVNRVSQALTEKLDSNSLVNFVGDQMRELFRANITYLAILDPETQIINFPYQYGDQMEPLRYGEGLTSRIISSKEPLLINHSIDREYSELGIKQVGKNAASYLGVPIPVEDEVIGVISVQSTERENRFDENDQRLLSTIASHVGIALHNAQLYEEAKAARAQAEDANEAKSAFLSTVSHELRTPLTSVLGFAKIIRKRLEDKIFPAVKVEDQKIKRTMKQVSENLGVVVAEGERLTHLINDVLDLAKIESGRMEWQMKPVFLQDVINRAISATSALFEEKGLLLKKNIPSDLPIVQADQDKLIQVMINLLSNAVKFTNKGSIAVEAYEDKGQIIVEVQDTGIGIAEEDKHKVFERFRQAGDTLTDKPQGTGLGLPICREIIEHHGGIIWLKSEYGVGSTFFFSIPVLGDRSQYKPLQLDRIVRSLKKQIEVPASSESQTILVVDDDTPIRSLLRQELTDAGYQVKEAADGKAALDLVRIKKPDLIILDVMMPEINGFDVAAVLKNDPETMDIPIIILSIIQDQERGLRIGVDRYLTKPIDTDQLFHEVGTLLEQGVSKKKVLVVDEDQSTVHTLSEVLTARGYKVLEASGKNLIEEAVEIQPDIIMLNSVYSGEREIVKRLKFEKGMEHVLFYIYQ